MNTWEDRIFNYFVGHLELGLPTDALEAHFRDVLGVELAERIFADIRKQLGLEAALAAVD